MNARKATASLALLAIVSGCAAPRLGSIPAGGRVAVELEGDRYGRAPRVEIVNGNVGTGAKTGMGAGAAVGVLGSLACGPFFAACAIIFAPVVMGAGALVGTAGGAIAGLPADTQEALLEHARRRDAALSADLVAAIRGKLATRWDVSAEPAPTRLRIRLDRASLVVDADHFLALAMRVAVTVDRGGRSDPDDQRVYEYRGLAAHPTVWTQDHGARIDEALRKAYSHIAEAVYVELAH